MAEPRLLFVCLGNICRSPAAEGVFLHLLAREGLEQAVVVDSAGTGGWHVGRQADPRMRAAAARRGIALPSRARQIERADLERFDRILTMDEDNLRAVQSLARAGRQKSERTDAEATDGNGAAHPGALVEPITNHCRRFRAREVPDPYYGGEEGFEQVLDLLEDACSGLLEDLRASLD
ncbi:low molecular weight protein-tyrosine-phosphatase [Synechococcus sp. CBW1107]|uniref:low molecular weight protein-tyrosine-phosphatase n=1 Tax=Synechococcus sp. CBW1107 TaxID=2789857 RepID=UPI002AD5851D|nr:low molecular weight protein-tyrosine-phosphatase [Synechococcus sp. CBW1107]CAK6701126.1 Putative low molecular weight protein-tyrosine-phosphatase [Synechococcus sp. CBW1107]